jgi:hypothetical protein
MPPLTQRRNRAYLNPLKGTDPPRCPDLELISMARSNGDSDSLAWTAGSVRDCHARAPRNRRD